MIINHVYVKNKWKYNQCSKYHPYIELIKLLCLKNKELNLKNRYGTIVLHDACTSGQLEEEKFLLKYGANVHSQRYIGETMLHATIEGHNVKLVEFLLTKNLDINAKNQKNETPLHKLLNFCCKSPFNSNTEKTKKDIAIIEFLIDNGATLCYFETSLYTPLEKSILYDIPELMECLLELKIDTGYLEYFIKYGYPLRRFVKPPFKNNEIEIEKLLFAYASIQVNIDDFISEFNDNRIQTIVPMYKTCKLELEQMKITKIGDNMNVTYYDLLVKDLIKVSKCLKNEAIVYALETEYYKKYFRLYEFFIKKRLERIQRFKEYKEIIIEYFNNKLPILVIDYIFTFLNDKDVRNLKTALYVE